MQNDLHISPFFLSHSVWVATSEPHCWNMVHVCVALLEVKLATAEAGTIISRIDDIFPIKHLNRIHAYFPPYTHSSISYSSLSLWHLGPPIESGGTCPSACSVAHDSFDASESREAQLRTRPTSEWRSSTAWNGQGCMCDKCDVDLYGRTIKVTYSATLFLFQFWRWRFW